MAVEFTEYLRDLQMKLWRTIGQEVILQGFHGIGSQFNLLIWERHLKLWHFFDILYILSVVNSNRHILQGAPYQ